jgi:hypothetical protein
MVDVVREADRDSALGGRRQRAVHDRLERLGKADVVDRDLERALRRREELGERVRGPLRRLPAVGECADR